MGYTHYWYRPKTLDADLFIKAVDDCKIICDKLKDIPLVNAFGKKGTKPKFGKEISFNGVGDDSHETFAIARIFEDAYSSGPDENGQYFDFCKTAHKPYDLPVMCCLIIFKHYFGDDFTVSSDGDNADWQPAREQVESVLGYGNNPVEDKNYVLLRR